MPEENSILGDSFTKLCHWVELGSPCIVKPPFTWVEPGQEFLTSMQRRTVNWWRQLSSRKGVMTDFAITSYTKGVFHAHSFRLRGLFQKHLSMLKTFSQRFSPIQALSHLNKSVRSPILIGNGDLDLVWLPMPGVWDAAEWGDHGLWHIPGQAAASLPCCGGCCWLVIL